MMLYTCIVNYPVHSRWLKTLTARFSHARLENLMIDIEFTYTILSNNGALPVARGPGFVAGSLMPSGADSFKQF